MSPVELSGEVRDYYAQLLAMGPAGEEAIQRVHFVTPESGSVFRRHHLALASLLVYSPRALARLRGLTAGREALILPSVVARDDLAVAESLGVPLLGPEPDISLLYSSKPGARRLFRDTQVGRPGLSRSP